MRKGDIGARRDLVFEEGQRQFVAGDDKIATEGSMDLCSAWGIQFETNISQNA